ncbi:MAG: sensor histidine kinase [Actinomycetota bacterium]|nr:sensor histidine kinase [Actinomycetota bacterium]
MSAAFSQQSFRHEALLYDGDDQFVAGVLPFIQAALAAGDHIVVVVDEAKIELLRAELASDPGEVHFADMREIGLNPARLIPAWREFMDGRAASGRRVWGVGEPIWAGRREAELVECQRHEALLNLAFAEAGPASFLCPYDTAALDAEVIARAHRSHPALVQGGTRRQSPSFSAHAAAAPFAERLPEPRGPVGDRVFEAGDLADVRQFVGRRARAAGLTPSRCDDLVLAVNEVASNSVRHGGGRGDLRIWREGDTLMCEVRDARRLDDPLAGRRRPKLRELGSYGLWIANQVCDLVQLRSFPEGSAVRIHMRTF